ncbi:STAS domain-containing protein [Vibrio sp. JC009]|uniref:STAS domain-containing protein n=1 Tax=Vibrio sp. JC009 TaxID=2912314 RepID=UPI0023B0108C|nr:STAS domain-containing protein [Vibrio sp. JC009]WED23399.1 STAS domain-containing protein [Vibrio sp. JC009]
MGMVAKKKNETLKFQMDSEMTIYNAAELKEELYKKWNKVTEIELNLSQVDELDCAGIQILLQLKYDSERFGKQIRFVEHSPAIIEALEMLNLIGHFGDPVVLSAEKPEA